MRTPRPRELTKLAQDLCARHGIHIQCSWTYREPSPPRPCFVAWDTQEALSWWPAWKQFDGFNCLQVSISTKSISSKTHQSLVVPVGAECPNGERERLSWLFPGQSTAELGHPMLGITHLRGIHKQEFPESEEARRKLLWEIVEGPEGILLCGET